MVKVLLCSVPKGCVLSRDNITPKRAKIGSWRKAKGWVKNLRFYNALGSSKVQLYLTTYYS